MMRRGPIQERAWFVGASAILIGAIATGWWLLPSPKLCMGIVCGTLYEPEPAFFVGAHPFSWAQLAAFVGGLATALFMFASGVRSTRTGREER